MLIKTRAIVLQHIKYGESSLIVTLYTEKYGRLTCIANGVRGKRARIPITFFQSLTLLETDIYYKQSRELHRIKEIYCPFHYNTIPFNVKKSTIALFIAELLYITLREEEGNASLFTFLFHSFQFLDTIDEGIANFNLMFMLYFSQYLGIFPEDLKDIRHGLHLPELQIFSGLPDDAVAAVADMLSNTPVQLGFIKLTNHSRSILLERILKYYTEHIDGISRLKSVQILKEIFN
jgi:DNA repair protein RecO (recombination protein O)